MANITMEEDKPFDTLKQIEGELLSFLDKLAQWVFHYFFQLLLYFLHPPCLTSSTSTSQWFCSISTVLQWCHQVLSVNIEFFSKFEH